MSRSYKKTPILKDSYGCKTTRWAKRQASKAVRKNKQYIASGSAYKKIYCTWKICDYRIREAWNVETQRDYESKNEWAKFYYYK